MRKFRRLYRFSLTSSGDEINHVIVISGKPSWAIGRNKSEINMNKWFDLESMFPSQDSFVSFLAIDFSKNDLFFAFKHNFLSFSMFKIWYESFNMTHKYDGKQA